MYHSSPQGNSRRRVLVPIITSLILSALGISFVVAGSFRSLGAQRRATVNVQMTLLGSGGRAIKDAEIWVTRPESKLLGLTDSQGKGSFVTDLPKGKLAVFEARGATFKVTRDVPIPHLAEYGVSFVMSPAEAQAGRVKIESITGDQKENRALNVYSQAVASKRADQVAAQTGNVRVTVSTPSEQAPLSPTESDFLMKLKTATERTSKKMRYSLLSKKIGIINLRLVRSERLFLELRTYTANEELLGGRIEEASKLRPQTLARLISEAAERTPSATGYSAIDKPQSSPPTTLLKIRKRPVDTLNVYLDGRMITSRAENDFVTVEFQQPAPQGRSRTLAVTGNSGLMISKPLEGRMLGTSLEWQWPEWLLTQRQGSSQLP